MLFLGMAGRHSGLDTLLLLPEHPNPLWSLSRPVLPVKLTLILLRQLVTGNSPRQDSTVSEVSFGVFTVSPCISGSLGDQLSRDQASREAATLLATALPSSAKALSLGGPLNRSLSSCTCLYHRAVGGLLCQRVEKHRRGGKYSSAVPERCQESKL